MQSTFGTLDHSITRNAHPKITVRQPEFNFDQLPQYYFNNNPLMSYLLTALSLTFPTGERFFVHSVRNVRNQVTSKSLQADVSAFIGQEAMHSHAHEGFNAFAERIGINVQPVLDYEIKNTEKLKELLNDKQKLAVTCALEHFTAIIAQYLLEHNDLHAQLHPDAARLWIWHALEETEHKAVAFDVYKEVFNDETVRKQTMRIVTATFLTRISLLTTKLLLKDKKGRTQWKQHWYALQQLSQAIKVLLPAYMDYYKTNFHPNQHDSDAIADEWRGVLFAS